MILHPPKLLGGCCFFAQKAVEYWKGKLLFSAAGVSLLPGRRWPRRGRKRNAGDAVGCGNMLRPAEIQPDRRSGGTLRLSDYRPYSSSVTKIGSEVPILATASPRGKRRALPRQRV